MSKLDNILDKFRANTIAWDAKRGIKKTEAKQQIKDLMHEIIGDYENTDGYAKPHLTKAAKLNQLKDKLHRKVSEL